MSEATAPRRRGGWVRPVAVAAACAVVTAAIGGTLTEIGPWYLQLHKPSWQPPPPAFGIIWTAIFSLATVAAVLAWQRISTDVARREWMIGLFALNGFFNVLWSLLFFRLHRPDWALGEVGLLWLSIAGLILFLVRISRTAAWLLAPYLAWVSVAAFLNLTIVRLNGPFG
jgi:tryptophan-rich sensory protein